jgi:hypothetical protein
MGLFEKSHRKDKAATPARDWQFKASQLALALGRPIRDQVFTTRDNRPTTFQALELVNGASLENSLRRGALRLLGQLPAAPENLFDSGRLSKGAVDFDIDISGLKQLWLLEEDAGSYDPARTVAGWVHVEFFGPQGVKGSGRSGAGRVRAAAADGQQGTRRGGRHHAARQPPGDSDRRPGYVRMRGRVALDDRSTDGRHRGRRALLHLRRGARPRAAGARLGSPPVPAPPPLASVDEAGQRLYLQLFARKPNSQEARIVRNYFAGGKLAPAALEDLLWSLLLHPEFQYLY